jgi:drug/metabolite transporter (DMT)-like permease
MSLTSRAWLQIHFCVLLWGFTAILGKLISLPAMQLVWWRMLMVSAALFLLARVWRGIAGLSFRLRWIYAGIGGLIALHWLAFYAAIKMANASVAATCMATAPLFLAWIEPLIASRKPLRSELVFGVLAIPAVALVVGGTPERMRMGIVVGVIAAALVAAFGALNKRYVERADATTVTALEIGAGTLLLTLIGPLASGTQPMFVIPDLRDFTLLAILAFGCTLLPFVLSLVALRHISAFGAQLATNLEPVYAILLAIPILGEQHELNLQFYLGVAAILGLVFAYPLLTRPAAAVRS